MQDHDPTIEAAVEQARDLLERSQNTLRKTTRTLQFARIQLHQMRSMSSPQIVALRRDLAMLTATLERYRKAAEQEGSSRQTLRQVGRDSLRDCQCARRSLNRVREESIARIASTRTTVPDNGSGSGISIVDS